MKTRQACLWLWLSVCCALAILGCSKGDTGPTGPAGAANVIYSEWYSPETWRTHVNWGIHYRAYDMVAPSLTQEIVDRGVVLVYVRFVGSNPAILQLPIVMGESPGYSFSYLAQADTVTAQYYTPSDPSNFPEILQRWNVFRYVLIPGGEAAATKAGASADARERLAAELRAMPYADVCRRYGIPE